MYANTCYRNFFFLLLLIGLMIASTSSEKEITINVIPGTEECFYEALKIGQVLDIAYQVIDGGQGALDISFYLEAPNGRIIVMDHKKGDKSHRIDVNENGDFKMCFDNRFSSFNSKTVYFELIVEAEDGTDVDHNVAIESKSANEKLYEMTVQDIEKSVNKVKSDLLKVRHLQESIRVFVAKDKNILEGNKSRINYWSAIQIIIMITVGLIQVIMVRSLFDDQSKIHIIWKKTGKFI